MNRKPEEENKESPDGNPSVTLPGIVEKIVPPVDHLEPEKAQIEVEGADALYKEIRVENTLKDESGREVNMKLGAHVDVTIEADPKETTPKKPAEAREPIPGI